MSIVFASCGLLGCAWGQDGAVDDTWPPLHRGTSFFSDSSSSSASSSPFVYEKKEKKNSCVTDIKKFVGLHF